MSQSIRPSSSFRINPITNIESDPRKALNTLSEATSALRKRNDELERHINRDKGSVERLRIATDKLSNATDRLGRRKA
jgi:hypothetical protein